MTTNKKRCFIACPVNEEILAFLKKYRLSISALPWSKSLRWTPDQNIHLTVKFLGDITDTQITSICGELTQGLAAVPSLTACLLQPTAFPNLRRPSVIASPVVPDTNLTALASQIDAMVSQFGIGRENRHFRGHVTIARIKARINAQDLINQTPDKIPFPIGQVIFYQSELQKSGPKYSILDVFKLSPLAVHEQA